MSETKCLLRHVLLLIVVGYLELLLFISCGSELYGHWSITLALVRLEKVRDFSGGIGAVD